MVTVILSVALVLSLGAMAWAWRGRESDRAAFSRELKENETTTAERLRAAENARQQLAERNDELHAALEKSRDKSASLQADIARLTERISHYEEELKKNRESDEAYDNRFKALAAEILNSNSLIFMKQQEASLEQILRPLKENIDSFRKTVTDSYSAEARERFSLMKSIEELVKTSNSIGTEARELSRALRGDSKVQGDWGEMVLESILEKSGLRRDEEFFVQVTTNTQGKTLRDDAGHGLRPDVVVKYPDGRAIIIDSKVSLTAYVDLVNATDDADGRDRALDRHLQSVKQHLKELRTKNYQDYIGVETTDFVMMFIPNEGAYMTAMQAAPALWQEAYDSRVLIVSPTHLVSALKLINQLWVRDRQTKNAIDIATQAGKLYDKFVGFTTDMESIGKSMDNTRKAWDAAMNKLRDGRGNIIRQVETLKEMGAKATKQLPSTTE